MCLCSIEVELAGNTCFEMGLIHGQTQSRCNVLVYDTLRMLTRRAQTRLSLCNFPKLVLNFEFYIVKITAIVDSLFSIDDCDFLVTTSISLTLLER